MPLAKELEFVVGKGGAVDSVEDENPPEMVGSEVPVVRGPAEVLEDAGKVAVVTVI